MLVLCCNGTRPPCFRVSNGTELPAREPGHEEIFHLVLLCYVLSILVFVGLFGNSLIIYLFAHRQRRSQVTPYILAMAGWDILLLLGSWLGYSVPGFYFYRRGKAFGHPAIMILMHFAYVSSNIAMIGCVWMTLLFSIVRYAAVCFPLRQTITQKTGIICIIVLSCCSILYGLPRVGEVQLHSCVLNNPAKDSYILSEWREGFGSESNYFLIYRIILTCCLQSFGPFIAMSLTTTRMICKVYKEDKRLTVNQASSRKISEAKDSAWKFSVSERKLTSVKSPSDLAKAGSLRRTGRCRSSTRLQKTLLIVLSKFLICYSLPTILNVIDKAAPEFSRKSLVMFCLIKIANFLVVVHSATNVFVFYLSAADFKRSVHNLFHCPRASRYRRRNARANDGRGEREHSGLRTSSWVSTSPVPGEHPMVERSISIGQ